MSEKNNIENTEIPDVVRPIIAKILNRDEFNAEIKAINPAYMDIIQQWGHMFESIGAIVPTLENGEAIFQIPNWEGLLDIVRVIYSFTI